MHQKYTEFSTSWFRQTFVHIWVMFMNVLQSTNIASESFYIFKTPVFNQQVPTFCNKLSYENVDQQTPVFRNISGKAIYMKMCPCLPEVIFGTGNFVCCATSGVYLFQQNPE